MRNRYERTAVAGEAIEPRPVWRTPRSRGMLTGLLLVLLGAWGALIPFIGPYFDFTYTPDDPWTWTAARGWLQVLPGVVAVLAGLMLLTATHRAAGQLAGWIGVAAGAWFILGPVLWPLFDGGDLGRPLGGQNRQVLTEVALFFGLGAAIILFSALAVGRFSISGARDVLLTREPTVDRIDRAEQSERIDTDTVAPAEAAYAGQPGYEQPAYGQPGYNDAPAEVDRNGVPANRESHGKHSWSPLRRFQHH